MGRGGDVDEAVLNKTTTKWGGVAMLVHVYKAMNRATN